MKPHALIPNGTSLQSLQMVYKLTTFAVSFLAFIFFAAHLNSVQAVNFDQNDEWGCHNGCMRDVQGYIVGSDGQAVNGVQVTVTSSVTYTDDTGTHTAGPTSITATTGGRWRYPNGDGEQTAAPGYFYTFAYGGGSFSVTPAGVPAGFTDSAKSVNTANSEDRCANRNTPAGSSSYQCQPRSSEGADTGCANSADCSFVMDYHPVGGTILDQRNNAAAGVSVQICNNSPTCRTVTTNSSGAFRLDGFIRGGGVYAVRPQPASGSTVNTTVQNGVSRAACGQGDQPRNSSSYECQTLGTDDCSTSQGSWHGALSCNFKIDVNEQNTISTPSVVAPSCIPANYTGDGIQINWLDSNPDVTYADISTNWARGWYYKAVSGTTTTGGGFRFNGSSGNGAAAETPLVFQPNTGYEVRLWNGSDHSTTASFNIPACAQPSLQSLKISPLRGAFSGADYHSGGQETFGSDWFNPMRIKLEVAPGSASGRTITLKKMIFAAYNVAGGAVNGATSGESSAATATLSTLAARMNDLQNGFMFSHYPEGRCDGVSPTANYCVYNGGWQAIASTHSVFAPKFVSTKYGVWRYNPGANTGEWGIEFQLNSTFSSKTMYTAAYVENSDGYFSYNPDMTVTIER